MSRPRTLITTILISGYVLLYAAASYAQVYASVDYRVSGRTTTLTEQIPW
jgi:hypothetical protein